MARALGASTSTTYRYVRSLVQFGFLDPTPGSGYGLGPAFIRYDRISRQNDALIRFASSSMRNLLSETTQSATVLLCRRFKECVMCVHEEHGDKPHTKTSYERGVAMPMFLGATSKVILAHLPERNLKSIYLSNEREIKRVGVEDWASFKEQMKGIKRAGFTITDSEVAAGRVGIAAPIFRESLVIAGLSLVFVPKQAQRKLLPDFASKVMKISADLSSQLSRS
jgi:DNA-binding IclR family transcriptional regulator